MDGAKKDMHDLQGAMERFIGEVRGILAPTPVTMEETGTTMLLVLDTIAATAWQLERLALLFEQTAFVLPQSAADDDHDVQADAAQAALVQSIRTGSSELRAWVSRNHNPLCNDHTLELLEAFKPEDDDEPGWRITVEDYNSAETYTWTEWLSLDAAWVQARRAAARTPIGQRVNVIDLQAPDAPPVVSFAGTSDDHLL